MSHRPNPPRTRPSTSDLKKQREVQSLLDLLDKYEVTGHKVTGIKTNKGLVPLPTGIPMTQTREETLINELKVVLYGS